MPRKPATELQKQEARGRIQKAAAAVYSDKGISGVTARLIAEEAGVSVGTLYSYFGSLQALMQSLWMEPIEKLNVRFQTLADKTPDPMKRLKALLKCYADFALRNPDLYRGAFMFVRPDHLPQPEKEGLASAVFPALIITAVKDGQAAGSIRPGNPARLAQMVWAGLHGAIALPHNIDRLAFDKPDLIVKDMIAAMVASIEA